jgi:prefoldin subunit 5
MHDTLDDHVAELERRITSVEDRMADLPDTINLRLETIVSAQHEVSARLGLMDKQMAGLVRDIRDLRGDVTRQMADQDNRLDTMELHIEGFSARFEGIGARLDGINQRLGALDRLQDNVTGMKQALQQLLDRG